MKDNLRQRALRKVVTALIGSDAFSASELSRLCSLIDGGRFTSDLAAILRQTADRLGSPSEDDYPEGREFLDSMTSEIAEIISHHRISKHEFIMRASEVYPPARELLRDGRMPMRELLREFSLHVPSAAKNDLRRRLIERAGTDEYLKGIMGREKGQR